MPAPAPRRAARPRTTAFLAATLVAALAGCAPDSTTAPVPASAPVRSVSAGPNAPSQAEARHVAAVRRRLERAAAGLLYTSESDYPFTFYHLPARATAPLTAGAFRALAGVPADTPVEEVALDAFLARHIERVDPGDAAAVALVPRYRALRRALRAAVRAPRVFRVGRIQIRCYLVGVDAFGNVTGLETVAIET